MVWLKRLTKSKMAARKIVIETIWSIAALTRLLSLRYPEIELNCFVGVFHGGDACLG